MSDLRDARLQRALESAPDDHLLPGERTREAIRAAARQAVSPPQPVPWWNKLWQSLGERHTPWTAALATVVLATLVTVLWREREIPGARPDGVQQDQPAPAASPPQAAPAPAPEVPSGASPPQAPPVTAPATAPARKTAPVGKPLPDLKRQPPSQSPVPSQSPSPSESQPQPQPSAVQPPSVQPRAEQAATAGERRAEAAGDALRDRSTRDLAKSAPAPRAAEASRQADVGAAARAPAPAAPAAMARAAPSGLASQREAPAGPSWTHLRIAASGRVVELARGEAPRLAQLVENLRRIAQNLEPLDAPVEIRIELSREGDPAGALELAGPQVRWTRRSGGGDDSFTARPESAQLEALRAEIGRLLR